MAAVLGLAACGSSPSAPADGASAEPYQILAVISLSGPAGSVGTAQQRGLQAAAEVINAEGGIQGRRIETTVVDDGGDPTKAVSLLQERLAGGTLPDLAVHGTTSTVALALLPVLTRAGVLSVSFPSDSRVNDPQAFPYAFGANAPSAVQAEGVSKVVVDLKPRKVAVLTPDDAFGTTIGNTIKRELDAAGVPYAAESFRTSDVDLTPQVERLKAADPDIFLYSALGASSSLVLQAVERTGLEVPLIGDNQVATAPITGVSPETVARLKVYATPIMVPPPAGTETKGYTAFMDTIKAQGQIVTALNLYSHQYDVVQMVKLAADQAKSTDRDAVVAALESLQQPPEGERPYVTYPTMSYSRTSHFPDVKPGDFVLTQAAQLQNGQFPQA
ncbi:ABC transporter substrate-binding protein [Pseudonocardia xishanensis]|uniref:Branched-chain amino acid ABC transporter substrate-binding protein n=1 Tax=Pseudonocardia xishanensis TaxID=630995 RepID=A0ABP8RRS5_9PSEU